MNTFTPYSESEFKSVLHLIAQPEHEMQMNNKQLELAQNLLATIKATYPLVELIGYARNPADKTQIRILVESPFADEDDELAFHRFNAVLIGNIAQNYGYDFAVSSFNPLLQIPQYSSRQAA